MDVVILWRRHDNESGLLNVSLASSMSCPIPNAAFEKSGLVGRNEKACGVGSCAELLKRDMSCSISVRKDGDCNIY